MSAVRVSVLTPPGTGAIATVEVAGPRAWEVARQLFRPAGQKPLPEQPELHRFWFGTLGNGGDEVILAVKVAAKPPHPEHPAERGAPPSPPGERAEEGGAVLALSPGGEGGERSEPGEGVILEVHCHGGRHVVRWVVEQFTTLGCVEGEPDPSGPVLPLLQRAPTLRTASILLDQHHGAFDRTARDILAKLEVGTDVTQELAQLAAFAPVGRHLVEPWKVVIAGPPNVGKSSLVNTLAGYQRSVVSEVAGTTRDVVTVPVAFDGWPVELADTAGLRDAAGLEAEGIDRARRFLAEADLIVWLMDATAPGPAVPEPGSSMVIINKVDRPVAWDLDRFPDALRVSALTGEGVPGLVAAIARTLVPHAPPPGAAVPYTPQLADLIEAAHASPTNAAQLLRDAIASA